MPAKTNIVTTLTFHCLLVGLLLVHKYLCKFCFYGLTSFPECDIPSQVLLTDEEKLEIAGTD